MSEARPVRIARTPRPRDAPPLPPPSRATEAIGSTGAVGPRGLATDRRENLGASQRAVRLSLLYAAALVVVFGGLVAFSYAGPAAGSTGTTFDLLVAGLTAALVGAVGVVVTLGSAPRAVELGEDRTVVVGRFGHRYTFPGRGQLRTTVWQRVPAGVLTSVPLESVELAGGSTRRTFLLDEGLLATEGKGALPST